MDARKLTLARLVKAGACTDARTKFKTLFGRSVMVTAALCEEHAGEFDWAWAARHLLTPAARVEYDRVTALASAEYARVTALAWADAYLTEAQ